jgi:lipoyl-dependent peroxiredoxin
MKIRRTGSTTWQGGFKDGKGAVTTQSGALLAYPFGFASRFEDRPGTNPEELIAAAHAGCFTMSLARVLGNAAFTATQIDTRADVILDDVDGGYSITTVHLTLRATVPGADAETFPRLSEFAKAGCPVSRLLKAEITLDAALV